MRLTRWMARGMLAAGGLPLALACVPHDAAAGPWARKPGSAYVQLGGTTLGYDRIYNDASEKAPAGGKVRDNVAQLFADVGVLPGFTVTAMAPLVSISFEPGAGGDLSNSGFGDLELGARYTFLERDGYAVAAALDLRLPTGDSDDPNGLLTGDGEVTAVPGILAGRSFHPLPLYVTAGFGYGLRGGRYSDDLRYSLEAGYGLWESTVTVILLFSGQTPLDQKPTVPSKAGDLGLDSNNRAFAAIIPKIFLRPGGPWAVSLSYATAFGGRNVGAGAVLGAGVAYVF